MRCPVSVVPEAMASRTGGVECMVLPVERRCHVQPGVPLPIVDIVPNAWSFLVKKGEKRARGAPALSAVPWDTRPVLMPMFNLDTAASSRRLIAQ